MDDTDVQTQMLANAEEEMPGMPSIDVAKLDAPKHMSTKSSSGEFVPEYSHKACTTVPPNEEWLNEPAAGSGDCASHYFWAEGATAGVCDWECMVQTNYEDSRPVKNGFNRSSPICPHPPVGKDMTMPAHDKCDLFHMHWNKTGPTVADEM